MPYRLQMVLAGTLDSYGVNLTTADEATYFHESVHWWQTAMTGYGQTAWHLFRQLTGFVFREWCETTMPHSNGRLISIHSLLAGSEKHNARLHSVLWSAENTLRIASARFRLSDPAKTFRSLFLHPPPGAGPWNVNPQIELNGEEYFLQGVDVIESHAHWNEVMFRSVLRGDPVKRIAPWNVSLKYRLAFEWFTSQVGQERMWLFPIICDLALHTIWNDMPQTEDEWQKTSPSWRFHRLTSAVVEGQVQHADLPELLLDYPAAADNLLRHCDLPELASVIGAALARERYRQPNMLIEQRMFAAMRFRQEHPFCVAIPWINPDILEQMAHVYGPPIIQIAGQLNLNLPAIPAEPSISCDPNAFMTEVVGELMLQAFVMQVLGKEPEVQPIPGRLQCGLSYFNINGNCQHQVTDNCPGSFVPSEGSPFPIADYAEDETLGCPFERFLAAADIVVKDLRLSTP